MSITMEGYLIGIQRYLGSDPTLTKDEAEFLNSAEASITKVKDQGIKYFGVLGLITAITSVNLIFSAKVLSIAIFGSSAILFIPLTLGAVGVLIAIDLYTIRNACRRLGKIFGEMNAEQKKNEELKKKEEEEIKLKEHEELKKKQEEEELKKKEEEELKLKELEEKRKKELEEIKKTKFSIKESTKVKKTENQNRKPGLFSNINELIKNTSELVKGGSEFVKGGASELIKGGTDLIVSTTLLQAILTVVNKSLLINSSSQRTKYAEIEEIRQSMNQLYILPNVFEKEITIEPKEEVVNVN